MATEHDSCGMTHSKRIKLAAPVVPFVALLVAGCGGSDGGDATASVPPPKTATGRSATVGVATTRLGRTLVDSNGRTLYLFKKDAGAKSACDGACATAWPPLRVDGMRTVGAGATASLLGTTPRSDGKPQVTYNGHPLYLYRGDNSAGDTNGQAISAFGAAWFALSPAGREITGTPSASRGGGGYY